MEFYFSLVQQIWEGDAQAPSSAYDATLRQHHTPALRFVAKQFVRACPKKKETITEASGLVLAPENVSRASELIDQEMIRLIKVGTPMLQKAIKINTEAMAAAGL